MGKRVLIADDSATIQTAFAMALGGEDLTLVPVRSFDEALTTLRQATPDLLIADVALAGRTGYDLCAAVKSDPAFASVRVYILASTQTPFDESRGREVGADGNLTKPFDSQSLIDRLKQALSVPARAQGPALAPTPPPVARSSGPEVRPAAPMDFEDDYGEFTIERPSGPTPSPRFPASRSAPPTATARPPPGAPASSPPAGLRPSLIPGANPFAAGRLGGAPLGARPASAPAAPLGRPASTPHPVGAPGPLGRPAVTPTPSPHLGRPAVTPPPSPQPASAPNPTAGRTIMGLPAVAIPTTPPPRVPAPEPSRSPAPTPTAPTPWGDTPPPRPASNGPGSFPAAHPPGPASRAPSTPGPGTAPFSTPSQIPALGAAISARVDEKVAALGARGPEYEAIARLSREVIEQVVWEVVPELAEIIVREHVERLAKK